MALSLTITFGQASDMTRSAEVIRGLEDTAVEMGLTNPKANTQGNQISIDVDGDEQAFNAFCEMVWYMDDVIKAEKNVNGVSAYIPCPG